MNWDTYQAAYQAADTATKALVDGETIPECVRATIERRSLNTEHQRLLVRLTTHRVLNAISDQELHTALGAANIPQATTLAQELLQCALGTSATPQTSIPPASVGATTWEPKSEVSALDSEIAEAEHALQSIPKIRTMAQDMRGAPAEPPTHQASSQDDLLRR